MALKPIKPVSPVKAQRPNKWPNGVAPVANPPHAGNLTSLNGVYPVANPPHYPAAGSEDHPVVHRPASESSPYPV